MEWIIKGLGWGLFLAILMGPLLFTLIQEGIEKGFRAGIAVGFGIWFSDLLFIVGVYYGVNRISQIIVSDSFQWSAAGAGSLILFVIGVGMVLSKSPPLQEFSASAKSSINYFSLFLKGFLINTINPFTIAFWTGLMTSVVFQDPSSSPGTDLTKVEATIFLSTILITIITTDTLKVLLAKKIRPYLKPYYIKRIRLISGLALVVFGIVMLGRVLIG